MTGILIPIFRRLLPLLLFLLTKLFFPVVCLPADEESSAIVSQDPELKLDSSSTEAREIKSEFLEESSEIEKDSSPLISEINEDLTQESRGVNQDSAVRLPVIKEESISGLSERQQDSTAGLSPENEGLRSQSQEEVYDLTTEVVQETSLTSPKTPEEEDSKTLTSSTDSEEENPYLSSTDMKRDSSLLIPRLENENEDPTPTPQAEIVQHSAPVLAERLDSCGRSQLTDAEAAERASWIEGVLTEQKNLLAEIEGRLGSLEGKVKEVVERCCPD